MENMSMVQARTPESLKADAVDILDKLGLNLSTYINMSLKQLVIQKRIPFEVKLNPSTYTASEVVREIEATLQMEGMKLEEDELELLSAYHEGKLSGDDIRRQILNEV